MLSDFSLTSLISEPQSKKYLLAVSGGVDSMVLLHLMHQKGYDITVAHVNFKLRENDCDQDEELVKQTCERLHIPFFSTVVDVKKYKEEHNASTQMAARELRYQWFSELLSQYNLDYVVTAHHLNDDIETLFINILRGSGIQGFTGISSIQNKVVRPLLSFTRQEIVHYAQKEGIEWREDKTNHENTYLRNQLRNRLFPVLKDIQPDFEKGTQKSLNFIREDSDLLSFLVEKERNRLFVSHENYFEIKVSELEEYADKLAFIFHLFKPYGFGHPQEIMKLCDAENSAEIQSSTHRLIHERGNLLLAPLLNNEKVSIKIPKKGKINHPFTWEFDIFDFSDSNAVINFDSDKIQFPLTLRTWREGDFFYPQGMKGKKKVSKFLKDLKLNKLEKENQWVLVDANDHILWVVNRRQDRRFSETKNTNLWFTIRELR